ncbi:hypothetical protein [Methylobacterium sp. J-068]|uniref:hypothetical protein n=1 Tax=Methylobacterium sp. J-068 TaxID=2836649 RepID=UPI001FBACE7F|nr:hypothetical protein [Methylobacterium sp. J-068]MCJ2036309.1 hypothetical protein [Methylobacterium sp. J-068]
MAGKIGDIHPGRSMRLKGDDRTARLVRARRFEFQPAASKAASKVEGRGPESTVADMRRKMGGIAKTGLARHRIQSIARVVRRADPEDRSGRTLPDLEKLHL